MNFDKPKLLKAVDDFSGVTVLVIGDIMLDEFIWGTVDRISPEAPVPVVNVNKETRLLGGAANTVNNIVSAGGRVMLSGVVGNDRHGNDIVKMLEEQGVDTAGIIRDRNRPTTRKTRVVAHGQQVVRFDREKKIPLGQNVIRKMAEFMKRVLPDVDAVIVSDYGKGVVNQALMAEVRSLFLGQGKIVAVDPKVQNFQLYEKCSIITPNHHEASAGSGVTIDSDATLIEAGRKILSDLTCESVLITRGEQGMTLFEGDCDPVHIPTVAQDVFDVTGAGDTVIAILTLGRATGLSRANAAVLANFAAGVVVGEVGTSAVTAEGLKEIVRSGPVRRPAGGRQARERSGT